ncbi:MAG: hypothetical protein LUQ54_00400 [Methanoregula sp.]|nr:hypothetical protein [Methanoregula sp.]
MVIIVIIAGCTTKNNTIPVIENKLSTLDPSEMALQLSDLPEGYVMVYSGSLNLGNNSEGLNAKKQFIVEFQKGTTPNTFINQVILVFPIDQINKTIPYISSGSLKISTTKQLSNPNIGDSSFAIRAVNSLRGGDIYIIYFVKKDVFEVIEMEGSVTDYETLKQLATTAAAKIK